MSAKKKFEDSYRDLQEIVKSLENNEDTIDDSLKKYKQAIKLIENCDSILKKAKLEIETYRENNGEKND